MGDNNNNNENNEIDDNEKSIYFEGIKIVGNYNPNDFICPITNEIFIDPVMAPDGHFYESDEIHKWMTIKKTSPITGEPMGNYLFPAIKFKCILEDFLLENSMLKKYQYKKNYDYIFNRDYIRQNLGSYRFPFSKLKYYHGFFITDYYNRNTTLLSYILLNTNDYSIIIHMIDNCVDLDFYDEFEYRPIQTLCKSGISSLIRYVIEAKKIELNFDIKRGSTPIQTYFLHNNKIDDDIVMLLMENTNDYELYDEAGYKLIHHIINKGSFGTFKLLIDKGVDIKCEDPNGKKPLELAIARGEEFSNYLFDKMKLNKDEYEDDIILPNNSDDDSGINGSFPGIFVLIVEDMKKYLINLGIDISEMSNTDIFLSARKNNYNPTNMLNLITNLEKANSDYIKESNNNNNKDDDNTYFNPFINENYSTYDDSESDSDSDLDIDNYF